MTKYSPKALNDTAQGIALLNSAVKMMTQTILQNQLAVDILPAAQGRICTLIKTMLCVHSRQLSECVRGPQGPPHPNRCHV
jgi:hypothetical protein